MKNSSSSKFKMIGQQKAWKREMRKQNEQDRIMTPQKSDAMLRGYEFIQAFMSHGVQVVR
ncbi:MAG: hypothetical protein Unbinned4336contig1000_17 [Prokaryotic dsDNA virus sp.]|mgnify:FL=1|nr:MAG: hypothetical protein Unbinned4336contig1000_17 [Prokaryotic dsDNA virus sp.]|tara:strand:- start:31482 stop:31661 length:180 start_codon:yes stop_codon:yes gene_type:complete